VAIEAIDPLPLTGILRFNHLHGPFNNKALRQAMLPAISQQDFMQASVGTDASLYTTGVGMFTPGTPLANDAGLAPLMGPRSIDRAKQLMREAGYTNQPMRLIGPTDILVPSALTQVGADLVRRLGFNANIVLSDWGTTVQRRCSPPSRHSISPTRRRISRCAAMAPMPGSAGLMCRSWKNCAMPGLTRRICRRSRPWRGKCRRLGWMNCPISRLVPINP
jgi:hypothetical protein